MLQSHFSLSVRDIIIQHDFWTASCTIRNSAALGKKMWFKLVLYYITVYLWSLLPSHTLSLSLWGHFWVCVCSDAYTYLVVWIPVNSYSIVRDVVDSNINTQKTLVLLLNHMAKTGSNQLCYKQTFDVYILGQRRGEGTLTHKPHRTPSPLISNQISPSPQLQPIKAN